MILDQTPDLEEQSDQKCVGDKHEDSICRQAKSQRWRPVVRCVDEHKVKKERFIYKHVIYRAAFHQGQTQHQLTSDSKTPKDRYKDYDEQNLDLDRRKRGVQFLSVEVTVMLHED